MRVSQSQIRAALTLQCKASPCKTALLACLALVLLLLLARQLIGGPDRASAAVVHSTEQVATVPPPKPVPQTKCRPRPPLPSVPEMPVRNIFEWEWTTNVRKASSIVAGGHSDDGGGVQDPDPALVLELTLNERDPDGGVRCCAVIGGRRVRAGDTIGGFVVESIDPGVVVLSGRGNERVILRMD